MLMKDMISCGIRRHRPESVDAVMRIGIQGLFQNALGDLSNTAWKVAPTLMEGLDRGPAIDVVETDMEYRVEVELPGFEKGAVDVGIDNGRLYIEGKRKKEESKERGSNLRVERPCGSFKRTLPIPSTVDEDKAEAYLQEGILTIILPKTAETQARKIKIKNMEKG